MEEIFKVISENPQYSVWTFGLVNALWLGFVYFNKIQHEKDLVQAKQSLDLDLERRKKVFEMKASAYENYFIHIDAIHHRHRTDYYDVLVPIINKFISSDSEESSEDNDKAAAIEFSEQILKITIDGMQEFTALEAETNSLYLTASDKIASLLNEIKSIYFESFEISRKMMADMVRIILEKDEELVKKYQVELDRLGKLAKEKSTELRNQMRNDLKEI